jgi:hypothetical protein
MFTTRVLLTLTLTLLLLLAATLPAAAAARRASLNHWNVLLFDHRVPEEQVQAYATCAAYYETLFDSWVWLDAHPRNILRRRRQSVAIDALRGLIADNTVIKNRILAAQDRLAFALDETLASYEALARQYEGPCTTLLQPLTAKD